MLLLVSLGNPIVGLPVNTTANPPRWSIIPGDPPGGGSGGGAGGGGGGGGGTPPGSEGQFKFTDKELKKLNECWQKLAKARLKSLEGDDKYEVVTGYDWKTRTTDMGIFGATVHNPKKGSPYVRIYPTSIQSGKPFDTLSAHVVRQAVLHEYIHTLQAQRAKALNPDWKDFAPYEWYDNEVQAWNLSRSWYYKLYRIFAPVSGIPESGIDFSTTDETFLANKAAYQDIEEKISKGLDYDEAEKERLEQYFKDTLPSFEGRGGGYVPNKDPEC